MLIPVFAKLSAEAMLSFYPMMIKLINIPLDTQMWTRFFTYSVISAAFVDWGFIRKTAFSRVGIALVVVSLIHVYTSYKGFQLLESGISYSLFYLYPIFILMFSKDAYSLRFMAWCAISLMGVYLLSQDGGADDDKSVNTASVDEGGVSAKWLGVIMIMLAALTEAMIYFIVREIKTDNNWNHVFLSYSLGAALLTGYKAIASGGEIATLGALSPAVLASLAANSFIGLFGYLLRFYATSRLEPHIYAPLSYFGVVMAYVYGIFLSGDAITAKKVFGTLCIVVPNLALLKT